MIKVRLDKSIQLPRGDGRFRQTWTITENGEHHIVVSEAEWGDVDVQEGGDRIYDIGDGIPTTAEAIIGSIISSGNGPCFDGEEQTMDAEWACKARAQYALWPFSAEPTPS